jgi:hypothetical protein
MAGSTGNATETDTKGPTIMAVMWSMTTLATIFVVARLCVRQRMLRAFGLDDWLIGISLVSILSDVLSNFLDHPLNDYRV